MPFDDPQENQDETQAPPRRFGYPFVGDEDDAINPAVAMPAAPVRGLQPDVATTLMPQRRSTEPQISSKPGIGQQIVAMGNREMPPFDIQDGRAVWRNDPGTLPKPNIGQRIVGMAPSWKSQPAPLPNFNPSQPSRLEQLPYLFPHSPSDQMHGRQVLFGASAPALTNNSPDLHSNSFDSSSQSSQAMASSANNRSAGSTDRSVSGFSSQPEYLRGPLDFNEFAAFIGGRGASKSDFGPFETGLSAAGATNDQHARSKLVVKSGTQGSAGSNKSSERRLQVPGLKGTVGGKGAQNKPEDVAEIQKDLNALVRDGQLPGFTELKITGHVDDVMLQMIYQYQKQALLGSPGMTPANVTIGPGKGTIIQLAKHPFVDKRWSRWDDTIKSDVAKYNRFFSKYPGFTPLDWRWVKAMIWGPEVHTGPDDPKWWTRPMQIGNLGDPALKVVKRGEEGSALFMDDELRKQLNTKPVVGELNVRAGIVYLYTRLIKSWKDVSVIGNQAQKTYTLRPGETLSGVANRHNTTLEELNKENGLNETTAKSLRPGRVLKYREAHNVHDIGSLNDWNTATFNYHTKHPNPKYKPYLPQVLDAYERIKRNWPQ